MPCSDQNYTTHPTKEEKRITYLEACLCALLTEMEIRPGEFEYYANRASKNGNVDIKGFWEEHKKVDIDRLKEDLLKYSEQELSMIKKMLNG